MAIGSAAMLRLNFGNHNVGVLDTAAAHTIPRGGTAMIDQLDDQQLDVPADVTLPSGADDESKIDDEIKSLWTAHQASKATVQRAASASDLIAEADANWAAIETMKPPLLMEERQNDGNWV